MPSIFQLPKTVPLSSSGTLLAGAKAYFYETGTSTPKNTYTDFSLTTPHANPVVADANGVFAPIFLANDARYRVTLKTTLDVTIYTVDDVGGPVITQSELGALLNPITDAETSASVTPVNFVYPEGVVNRYGNNTTPGTTDMTLAIQAALDVAHNGAGKAILLSETYLTGQINWPGNNITLQGEASAFSYNTSAAPKSILKAKTATSIVLDLVQTGVAEDRTGNHICDLSIDGNSIASVGIDCAGANIIERVQVKGCTTAGVRLSNFTNSTRIVRCGLNSNSGYGLKVEGVSTTAFSVDDCNISLNTSGGVNLEAGVIAQFSNCVVESNAGPGLRVMRVTAHTNEFSHIDFDDCWFEDNASNTPYFTIVMDSELSGDTSKDVHHVHFTNCNITAGATTRKYMNLAVANNITFEDCRFSGSTETAALTVASRASLVAFLECATGLVSGGLTETQIDTAVAAGTRCYASDRDVKRAVGGASPAVGFQNSWANNGGGYAAAKYWFDREGNVCLQGSVDTGSSGTVAFTLPAGYRPATTMAFAIDANGAHGLAVVGTDGTVTLTAASTANTHLNGIRFPTA